MLFRHSRIFGFILVIIGIGLLLNGFHIRAFIYIWPVLLIAAGLFMIVRCRHRGTATIRVDIDDAEFFGKTCQPNFSGEIDGADINHFIGETELNLSNATLKPGINKLHASAFIGSIRLLVPASWALEASGSLFLGNITLADRSQSGIAPTCKYKSEDYDAAEKKLHIDCSLFIGEIKVQRIQG